MKMKIPSRLNCHRIQNTRGQVLQRGWDISINITYTTCVNAVHLQYYHSIVTVSALVRLWYHQN